MKSDDASGARSPTVRLSIEHRAGSASFMFHDDDLSDAESEKLGLSDDEEDATAWRELHEEFEDDQPAVDGRVASAFDALNEAIAQNNELETAHSAAVRALEVQRLAANALKPIRRDHAKHLQRIEKFRAEQAAANGAATELRQADDALMLAREILQCANEALELQREGAGPAERADADWREAEATLEARRALATADVRRLVGARKRCAAELERRTRRIVERSGTLGDAVGEALVPLAQQASYERQLARAEEHVRATGSQTAKAKASVKEAMHQLETISLDIQQQQQQEEERVEEARLQQLGAALGVMPPPATPDTDDAGAAVG